MKTNISLISRFLQTLNSNHLFEIKEKEEILKHLSNHLLFPCCSQNTAILSRKIIIELVSRVLDSTLLVTLDSCCCNTTGNVPSHELLIISLSNLLPTFPQLEPYFYLI